MSSNAHRDSLVGMDLLGDLAPQLDPMQCERIKSWLSKAHYQRERPALLRALAAAKADPERLKDLSDAFSQLLPIGTGGRRGKVAPGSNRMNQVTMRESVYGLHCTMKAQGWPMRVIVGYDTRATSRSFAHLCSQMLLDLGVELLLLDAPCPTPQIVFWLRQHGCGAGIVISASHNPPEDNGIKIYGPDGAQVFAQRDRALSQAIREQGPLAPDCPLQELAAHPKLTRCDLEQAGRGYLQEIHLRALLPDRSFEAISPIVYTALQGVGLGAMKALVEARKGRLVPVPLQCDPGKGDFSACPVTNPEIAQAFDQAIATAKTHKAPVILAHDPDADRLGVALWSNRSKRYDLINGNRVAALLVDHVCRHLAADIRAQGMVASTVVTSPLIGSIARAYGVGLVVDDLLVGFKNHAALVEQHPNYDLLFACEESLGYVRGRNIRDKDGTMAAMLVGELLSDLRAQGLDYQDRLDDIWRRHGFFHEYTENLRFPGIEGAKTMQAVMQRWRQQPLGRLGAFENRSWIDRSQPSEDLASDPVRGAPSNLLVGSFEGPDGLLARVALRPSGTEPKLKLYLMCQAKVHAQDDLDGVKARVVQQQEQLLALALAELRGES